MYFYNSIGFQGTRGRVNFSSDSTTTWVDPFVGGRWRVPLIGELDMVFRGDMAASMPDRSSPEPDRWLPVRPAVAHGGVASSLVAAYKAFDFDYEGGGEHQGRLAEYARPLLGAAFNF